MPFNLSAKIVDVLLEKLASDDAFREQFQRDPRSALASIGHGPAADSAVKEGIWACCATTALASKQEIAASRDKLRSQLMSAQASYHPITLEASASR
jgi:putative modified peptide